MEQPYTTARISYKTNKDLMHIKLDKDLASVSEVIDYLIAEYVENESIWKTYKYGHEPEELKDELRTKRGESTWMKMP